MTRRTFLTRGWQWTGLLLVPCARAQFLCAVGPKIRGPDGVGYDSVVAEDGKTWLDRNLGASRIATTSTDSLAYGHLYQWGRYCDGHQVPTSGTTAVLSTTDTPGHGNFITIDAAFNDWRNPQNDLLWQGLAGTNNPCPAGYRLPTQAEWAALVTAAGIIDAATAFSCSLKIPVAGFRNRADAVLTGQGTYGYYWTSGTSGTDSKLVVFSQPGGIDPTAVDNRAYGFSVRCIKN